MTNVNSLPRVSLRPGLAVLAAVLAATGWLMGGVVSSATGQDAGPIIFVGGRIVRPDGTLQEDMAVVVRDGKIKRLMPASDVPNGDVRRFGAQTVICPGLIELFSSIGAAGQSPKTLEAIDADASVIDALAPTGDDFKAALQAGITATMVAPDPDSLVAGSAVTFRTWADGGQLDVLRDDGPLLFAFGPRVWRDDRPPTSRAGALFALRELLKQAQQGAAAERVNAVIAGNLDALLVCDRADDLRAVRGELGDAAKRFGIVHTADAIDVADELAGCDRPVVVGPYAMASPRRALLGAAALSRLDIEVAFAGGMPEASPETLRITAAIATRYGMQPAAARRAMTIAPARVAGVAKRIGSIAPGKDADMVVFSRDPLRLDAAVMEVYIKGRRVYSSANQNSSWAGATP